MFGWLSKLWDWFKGPTVGDDIEGVRDACLLCCGFVPTVGTVAAILTANNPAVVGVTAVAVAICNAVSDHEGAMKIGSTLMEIPPMVNGVVIEGTWKR